MDYTGTILIVDDDLAGCETLKALLLSQGHNLLVANTGVEGITLATASLPDLILLDVMLPGMDGYEVCQRLRSDPLLAEVPIIMLTALDDRESRLRGIEAGADDFISKPFDRTELRLRVRSIMRLNRYRRLLAERARFERIIEFSPDGIVIVNAEGTILLANPATLQLLGAQKRSQVVEKNISAFIVSTQWEDVLDCLDRIVTDTGHSARLETEFTRMDHSHFAVEMNAGYYIWEDEPAAQIVLRDISERKQAEAQIQRHIQHLTALRTIDTAITSSTDRRVTLNIILEQVVSQLHVDAAMLLLLEPHSQILEVAAGRGFTTGAIRQTRLRLNEDYPGRAARERRMLTVRHPDETQPMSKRSALLESECFSTYYAVPLIAKGQVKGVLELFQHNAGTPDAEWLGFLEALAMQAAIAIDNANLFDDLQRANTDLALAYDATLEGWVHALDLRDNETEGHTQRVTEATVRLARNMGFSEAELVHVRRGALLHDIGKMAIPDKILLKPGPLTDAEWEIMRRHPVYAYDWLAPIAFLRPSLDIPYCHHERWDGSGYPRGLCGEEIPLLARIFAVVDVWDALRSDRPYRRQWPEAEVRDYIQSQAGTQFDPQIVAQFLQADLTTDVMLCLNGEYRQPGMTLPEPGEVYDAGTIPEVGNKEDGTMLSYCCNRTSQPGRP